MLRSRHQTSGGLERKGPLNDGVQGGESTHTLDEMEDKIIHGDWSEAASNKKSGIIVVQDGVLDDNARVYDGLYLAGCAAAVLGDSHRCMPSLEIETKIRNNYLDYARILCYSKSTWIEHLSEGGIMG